MQWLKVMHSCLLDANHVMFSAVAVLIRRLRSELITLQHGLALYVIMWLLLHSETGAIIRASCGPLDLFDVFFS